MRKALYIFYIVAIGLLIASCSTRKNTARTRAWHSFSAKYFNEKFATERIDAEYSLYPVQEESLKLKVEDLLSSLDGFNVTLPYKQAVIPFLERLDETAQAIGAVNVVYKRVGYNTDCIGFLESMRPLVRDYDQQALVLGTGGASKAVCYGLCKLGITPTLVSRTPKAGQLGYTDLTPEVMAAHTIIVNCTPLGMFPKVDTCPDLPYEAMDDKNILYDLIYNPDETLFMKLGAKQGASVKNGLEMLLLQAFASWEFWNGKE